MPWTVPNPSETAATPASAPVATGTNASPRTATERNASSSIPATITVAIVESRRTSPRIASRDRTAKTAGPERSQDRDGRADLVARGGEGLLDEREVCLLRVEIEPRRRGLHEEERGALIARHPDAEVGRRASLAFEPGEHPQELAGRIGRQVAPHERAGGRGERLVAALERGGERVAIEVPGRDAGAENVAVREQEVAVGPRERRVPVRDVDELGPALQPLRERAAERGELVGLRVLDADQQQPRGDALAQLADEQPLRRRRGLRQERGHVRGEARVRRDDCARGDEGEPGEKRPAPGAQPRSFGLVIVITERSPLASRISIRRTSPPAPPISTFWTSSAICGSDGRRCSRQSDQVPSSSTR